MDSHNHRLIKTGMALFWRCWSWCCLSALHLLLTHREPVSQTNPVRHNHEPQGILLAHLVQLSIQVARQVRFMPGRNHRIQKTLILYLNMT
jgi:hypothetical protein